MEHSNQQASGKEDKGDEKKRTPFNSATNKPSQTRSKKKEKERPPK